MSVTNNAITAAVTLALGAGGLTIAGVFKSEKALGHKHGTLDISPIGVQNSIPVDSGDTYTVTVKVKHRGKTYLFADTTNCDKIGGMRTKTTYLKP